jgi:hypothetical protein
LSAELGLDPETHREVIKLVIAYVMVSVIVVLQFLPFCHSSAGSASPTRSNRKNCF